MIILGKWRHRRRRRKEEKEEETSVQLKELFKFCLIWFSWVLNSHHSLMPDQRFPQRR